MFMFICVNLFNLFALFIIIIYLFILNYDLLFIILKYDFTDLFSCFYMLFLLFI